MADIGFSFVITTYNNAAYIREAMESALAQDYPDIEIIVCDDHSSDDTVAIAREVAAAYHGPIPITIHRNEVNLKPAANFYTAATLATKDWLVMAAGDDVSLPNRASFLADAIRKHPQALALTCKFEYIDDAGLSHGYSSPDEIYLHGAGFCWHRRILADFPAPPVDMVIEDIGFYPRIFMLGGSCVLLPEALVRYRLHGTNISGTDGQTALSVKRLQRRFAGIMGRCTENQLADLNGVMSKGPVAYGEQLLRHLEYVLSENERDAGEYSEAIALLESPWWRQLWSVIRGVGNLRLVLSSWRWLVWLKRRIFGNPGHELLSKAVPALPDNLPEREITVEDFLSDLRYGHFHPLHPECFHSALPSAGGCDGE